MKCATGRKCRQELATGTRHAARTRRAALQHVLLDQLGPVPQAMFSNAIACRERMNDCSVQRGSRFVQVKEPQFSGDSARVPVRVLSNTVNDVLPRVTVLTFVRTSGEQWVLKARDVRGAR